MIDAWKIVEIMTDEEIRSGVFSIDVFYGRSVHMTREAFLETFDRYTIDAWNDNEYPWKISVKLGEVEFFAILTDEHRKELQK